MKIDLTTYVYIVLTLAIILSILNVFMIDQRKDKLQETKEILKEQLRPADLQITKIVLSSCADCYDIEQAILDLKKQNVNITKEELFQHNTLEAKELIKKYDIKKLPSLIIAGEINKSEQLNRYFSNIGEIKDNTIVLNKIKPPYFDNVLQKVVGRVSIINIIDPLCTDCRNLTHIPSALRELGIAITDEKTVDYNSQEGQNLVKDFKVKRIPALLLSKEVDFYDEFKQEFSLLNLSEKNGFYAIHSLIPPYKDLDQNKIVGLVDIILLKSNACTQCYDVNINKDILERFGMVIKKEDSFDINSKEAIELKIKYNITKVPILILSPEANVYPDLIRAWKDVGTIENDGWFIMRHPEVLGTYFDLETNKVVEIT